MRTLFKAFFILALGVVLLSVLGGFSLAHHVFSEPGVHIVVNGDEWSDPDVGDFIGAAIGMGVAGLVCFIVLPLVLLFAVGLPLLIVGGVIGLLVLVFCGVGAVVFSPAFLVILVLWLLLRRPKPRVTAPAPRP
ncbi:MAG TPA: hypothetical protein VK195_02355 [Burkholderiaceae bacterium]|nr:hypothetical protein [Burkholderiaceae bacterium]